MNESNAQTAETDETILRVARSLYGETPWLRKCHSGTNYCVVLSFGSRRADRVFKLANRNDWAVEFERHLYPPMRDCGLPVPEIEFTQKDCSENVGPFIVMPKFSDYTLSALQQVDVGSTVAAFEKSARFALEIHDKFNDAFEPFLSLDELNGTLKLQQQAYEREPDLSVTWDRYPGLAKRLESLFTALPRPTAKRLIHGFMVTPNVMANEKGEICVIDLGESVGRSSPLKDLCALLVDANHESQTAAALRGYGAIDQQAVRELRYWELHEAVHRMQGHLVVFPNGKMTKVLTDRVHALVDGNSRLPDHLPLCD